MAPTAIFTQDNHMNNISIYPYKYVLKSLGYFSYVGHYNVG